MKIITVLPWVLSFIFMIVWVIAFAQYTTTMRLIDDIDSAIELSKLHQECIKELPRNKDCTFVLTTKVIDIE